MCRAGGPISANPINSINAHNRLEPADLVLAGGVAASSDTGPTAVGVVAAHDTLHHLVQQRDALAVRRNRRQGLRPRAVDAHGLLCELERSRQRPTRRRRPRRRAGCLRRVAPRRREWGWAPAGHGGEGFAGRAWGNINE
jgi:hypothetical protein